MVRRSRQAQKNLLIQNALILNPVEGTQQTADMLVEKGVISEIGSSLPCDNADIIDAQGLWLFPGLVDIHVHLREPGAEGQETIATGTQAAAAGGITSVACMGNTAPPIDNKTGIDFILERANETGIVRVYPVGTITKRMEGREIAPIGEMVEAGAVAIHDETTIMDSQVMRRAMEYATIFDIPILTHPEDHALTQDGFIHEGAMAIKMGLIGKPAEAEAIQVARDLLLAKKTGARIHITHVSTAESVDLIRFYKKKGIQATCETAPHYLLLTDEATEGYNTRAKVNPPLRTKEDQKALFKGLKDGTIDCIASDHSPYTSEDKNVEFPMAPEGMIGMETLLPLVMNQILHRSKMDLLSLLRTITDKPAQLLNLPGGRLDIGQPADLVLWDPEPTWTIDKTRFRSKSCNSMFDGFEVQGRVNTTFVGGEKVYTYEGDD